MNAPQPTAEQVTVALAGVKDPEIGRPITELNMVKSIDIANDGRVDVGIYLTVAGCPMREEITSRVTNAVSGSLAGPGGMLDFRTLPHFQPVILDPTSGAVVSGGTGWRKK